MSRPSRFSSGKYTMPIAQEAGCAPMRAFTGVEKIKPLGIAKVQIPNLSAHSVARIPTTLSRTL
jgi:hypothetical protein